MREDASRLDASRLIVEQAPSASLVFLLKTLPPLDDDFGPIDDLPANPVDL